jgi:HPr kinase/phosphorylase
LYTVKDFYDKYGTALGLKLLAGSKGLDKKIKKPKVYRPGLGLAGYVKNYVLERILIFGTIEMDYLREMNEKKRFAALENVLTPHTPAAIVARRIKPFKEMYTLCNKNNVPLFKTNEGTMSVLNKSILFLVDEFSPMINLHGTLVEVFGVGVLIQGDSSIGKSEAALGLLYKGHRLISDDIVMVKKKEDSYLMGFGPDLTRHLMEIRGIGIINVANLYGAVSVRKETKLDMVIQLEEWNGSHAYDRIGLEEKFLDILGINVPYHLLPVKTGRDLALLIETLALNHRLKSNGYNSAREFNLKMAKCLKDKKKRR